MFRKSMEVEFMEPLEGVRLRTLVHGQKMSLVEFYIKKGTKVPIHSHPHEQAGYLVSGRLLFIIEEKGHEAEPGSSWYVPSNVKHGAEALEDTIIIEVFSPPREDYMKK